MPDERPKVDDILSSVSKVVSTNEIEDNNDERKTENDNEVKNDENLDPVKKETGEDNAPPVENKTDDNVDEFGNAIEKDKKEAAKPKLYDDDDVNRMIRQRLKQGEFARREVEAPPVQPQSQPEAENDNWEAQLEGFVKQTISKISAEEQNKIARAREEQIKSEFENKFLSGMSRYSDFREVVGDKPITDTMMLATRSMRDPAAFLYAAAKSQVKELERIAKIPDAYAQVAEIGRLEERMRKIRNSNSSGAPRPLEPTHGDVANVGNSRGTVDDLILKDARRKLRR